MPSRKSDGTKQSNVSMAQFVYDGSDADVSSNALRPSSVPIASRSRPTPLTEMDSQRASVAAPAPDKDKKEPKESKDTTTIEDLTLPKSIITRLAKGVLPPNTQIQANAILAMSKSAVVFINHLANAANERTMGSGKKTIMPDDVFSALADIEYPFFREPLEAEFKKFNEVQTTKRTTYRRKVAAAKKAEKAAAADPNASMMSTATATTAEPDATPASRAPKKHKANGPDDSAMDVDADEEPRDASDADTEPEQEHDEEEDEDENAAEDDDEEEEEDGEDDEHDRLEDREPRDEHDDALDDGESD
ncbi:histone-fold-containing protein [Hypoxylon sp. FL1284]|nr:histone-fold-containing protein [Hypoxylon sp. FL1284]